MPATLTRQAQQPLGGDGQQDLLGAAGDSQAARVEEVEDRSVVFLAAVNQAAAFGDVHREFGQCLPVAHANQLSHAGLCAGIWPPTASWAMR